MNIYFLIIYWYLIIKILLKLKKDKQEKKNGKKYNYFYLIYLKFIWKK